MIKNRNQSGLSFIGILIALGIIAFLYFYVSKTYWINPSGVTKEVQKDLAEQGINTSNLPETIQKAKETAEKASQLNKKLEKEYSQKMEDLN
ncbi:MAG: hypothetical protein NT145_03965 [Elusimicrobia bacterium]|nr:hypothetical protein [Elusimicrobiota bacterium]